MMLATVQIFQTQPSEYESQTADQDLQICTYMYI